MWQNDGRNIAVNPVHNKFQPEADLTGEHVYIVRLHGPTLSQQYQVLQQKTAATAAVSTKLYGKGQHMPAELVQHQADLLKQQQQVLQQIDSQLGQKPVRRQFTATLNGFSLSVTQDEAQRIAALPGVASVQRSTLYQLHTDAGPAVIEADQVWAGNTSLNLPLKGEGVVVGVLDTGVNTDHPSFAAVAEDGYLHINPLGSGNYIGDCQVAGFEDRCNDKLIGVRSYPVITDTYQYMYPAVGEDLNGHGSHTASTAAGNTMTNVDLILPEVSAASDGILIKQGLFPQVSGVAPRANIISYQVCYPHSGCPGEALLAAIEDAVTDGVDVINFSIGNVINQKSPWQDTLELAFLGATKAGVATAAAAGNAGGSGYQEQFGYIDHASPWLLNVAATTTGRSVDITTTLDNFSGADNAPFAAIAGGGINDVALTGVLVDAANYGDIQCLQPFAPGTFDQVLDANNNPIVDGEGNPVPVIVACQRGENARVEKAEHVAAGGAEGFVLYNLSDWGDEGTISYTDRYVVPGLHITANDWYGLSYWLQTPADAGHWLTISATEISRTVDADQQDRLAEFSSRGPSLANPYQLVPSVSAPGVNIYAAYKDESPLAELNGEAPVTGDFNFLSGTSMAAPHVAGALALLTQAHPDWTVAEKYSALQLTAEPEVAIVRYEGESYEQRIPARIYRAGTGRINVKHALDSGLVMNESHDNMLAADPNNGGLPHKLNVPQLVNFNCRPTCTWMRTFTATKDGSWELSADPVVNFSYDTSSQYVQNGVQLDIVPASFTLKAGESQTVMVTAGVTKTHDIFGNSEVELQSHIMLREVSNAAPKMHIPVVFKYNAGDLPEKIDVNMHAAAGNFPIKGIVLPESDAPVANVYQPVAPHIELVTLPTDDETVMPWPAYPYQDEPVEQIVDEATSIRWITVPESSKRLVVEQLDKLTKIPTGYVPSSNLVIYVGKDVNGDGIADPRTEILCASLHTIFNNYCYIDDPEPGEYWAMVYNPFDYSLPGDYTYKVAYAVVSGDTADNLTMQLPANTNGVTPVTAELNWDLPDAVDGDLFYSGFDIGSSANNPSSAGFVPLRLTRGANHISVSADRTRARVGQSLNLTFAGLPNLSGADRGFNISAALPAGLVVDTAAIRVSDDSIVTNVSIEDGLLTISGQQADTSAVQAEYVISTNQDDAMCYMPDFGQNDPTYVDLLALGATPSFGGDSSLDLRMGTDLPFSMLFADYDGYKLYNNEYAAAPSMQIRGNGNITFSGEVYFYPAHYPFPYGGSPHEAMGVLWRGWGGNPLVFDPMFTPFNGWDEGITVAYSTEYAVVQWNGSRSVHFEFDPDTWEETRFDLDDRFNFQVVMHKDTRFEKGAFEFYFGYQHLHFNGDGRGSVGIQGYRGQRDPWGPILGHLGSGFAYEDLEQKLQEGLVVCMDYNGPESSQFSVTVPVRVTNTAIAQTLNISGVAQLAGMADMDVSVSLEVPGNISNGVYADITIVEDTMLEDFFILYADEANSANTVSITGANISAEVHSHKSGGKATITPAANFFGSTEVTVTVADKDNPADKASSSFMLHVTNVNDGPEAKVISTNVTGTAGSNITLDAGSSLDVDGDVLTYSWSQTSGTELNSSINGAKLLLSSVPQGSYKFEVTVSDGQATDTAEVSVVVNANTVDTAVSKKSGGSFGFWLLAALGVFASRRQRQI
uniref:Serine protease, subtilase family n=1 Tax=Rheinheimera sp. BAL341 TaxID=1708203 RepID=A0A486XVM1_9GAMM